MTDTHLKPFEQMQFHPMSEALVDILQTRTQNPSPNYFRVMVAYYFGVLSAQMRASISGWVGKGTIPINIYAINLSPSGTGKGHSVRTIEDDVINKFREVFLEHTFPVMAENNLETLALRKATRNGTAHEDELAKLRKEFNLLGALDFTFDGATTPAIKQMRQKLLMANAGACNLQVDEIGLNFQTILEPLTSYLELYDKGVIKDKLIKSTADNIRFERIEGVTPANCMLFGTPSKLLDGGAIETSFIQMLDTGYARRSFFGFTRKASKVLNADVDEVMAQMFDQTHDAYLTQIADQLRQLADVIHVNKVIQLERDNAKYLILYKMYCEQRASLLDENLESIKRAELDHRYFKVLKLAGAYAFIDGSPEITQQHLEYAMKLAEESGDAFALLLAPQRPYIKLAVHLAECCDTPKTLADLDTDLPYYRGSKSQKEEMITMATAWGYKNNIIIKKAYSENILFLHGETITETEIDKMNISYSQHPQYHYSSEQAPFSKLPQLLQLENFHWVNHPLLRGNTQEGIAKSEHCIKGFNLLCFEVQGSISLNTAKLLLNKYQAIYSTAHTDADTKNFRIILPLNYTLTLDETEYKEFYLDIANALPFSVNTQTASRAQDWNTQTGYIDSTSGELFDVLSYIPKTSKNEAREKRNKEQVKLDRLERWILNNNSSASTSELLQEQTIILNNAGVDFDKIRQIVTSFNEKLPYKISEADVVTLVVKTTMNLNNLPT